MTSVEPRLAKNILGLVLVLALVIGGGTGQGLYTDFIIQIAVIVAVAIAFTSGPAARLAPAGLVILAMMVVAGVIQVTPLPSFLNSVQIAFTNPEIAANRAYISLGVGQTLESLAFALSAVVFSLALMRLSWEQLIGLLPFFFVGLACNLLASLMQFSLDENVRINSFLPFTITSGSFANVNHFSSLLFLSIPLIVYSGLFLNRLWISIFSIALILLTLLAAGSRAGMAIGLAITILSIVFITWRSRVGAVSVIMLTGLVTVFGYSAIEKIRSENLDAAFGRTEFALTTMDGIRDNWIFGVGYGNFAKVYQVYEKGGMIFSNYVNHAHNDYLEIVFEGGVLGAFVLISYVLFLMARAPRSFHEPFMRAAFLSIVFILFHSLVDYPLRTMAIALSFAFLNAVYFHQGAARQSTLQPQGPVSGDPVRLSAYEPHDHTQTLDADSQS